MLDVKIGTVLYAEDATPEKKKRMEEQAKTTTTWETGIRLTGCQVSFGRRFFDSEMVPSISSAAHDRAFLKCPPPDPHLIDLFRYHAK